MFCFGTQSDKKFTQLQEQAAEKNRNENELWITFFQR
jgi:hypothetical protein